MTTAWRFVRYVMVGAVATAVHWALLATLVECLAWSAWIGSGIGAIAGAQVAFIGNRAVTFTGSGQLPWGPAWLKFQFTAGLGAALGMVVVAAGVVAGLHYLVAQAIATVGMLLVTFGINAAWTFRHHDSQPRH